MTGIIRHCSYRHSLSSQPPSKKIQPNSIHGKEFPVIFLSGVASKSTGKEGYSDRLKR